MFASGTHTAASQLLADAIEKPEAKEETGLLLANQVGRSQLLPPKPLRTKNEDPCKTHQPGATDASSGNKHKESGSKPEVQKTDPEGRGKVSSLQMRVLHSGLPMQANRAWSLWGPDGACRPVPPLKGEASLHCIHKACVVIVFPEVAFLLEDSMI